MRKIIPITGLILSMSIASASAQVVITENKLDINTGILTVTGVTDEPNSSVSLNIPKIDVSPEDLQESENAGDYIMYSGQKSSGEDGKFTFTVDFKGANEGIYDIYVGGEAEDVATLTKTSYVMSENYKMLIGTMNIAAQISEEVFYEMLDGDGKNLFVCAEVELENQDVARKILYDFAKSVGLNPDDSVFNMSVYKAALVTQLMSEGRIAEAESILDGIYEIENGIIDKYDTIADFKTYVDTEEKKAYFASVFKACTTLEEFDKEFANAMLLTLVKYPDNVTDLKKVFDRYSAYTGAKIRGASLLAYSAISGKTYSDINDCVADFNKAAGGNNGGGGGGGGSSSGSSSDFGVVTPGVPSADNGNGGKINIKFEDLNSVPWAYSAISELFDRNIISGRSETRFSPNDRVTREEFATMLVKMAGVNIENGNAFADVDGSAWYNGYVNTAYKYGFCNGTGNGTFGVGMEITRQDMCVMAYNTLVALGHKVPDGNLVFADSNAIADYARTPVAALNGAGVVNGVGNNAFNPTGSATRAEAAVIIYKVLMYIG